jgi:hypothetical protein
VTKNDLKQKILLANEDLSLENPVDLQLFEEIKMIRSKLKKKNQEFFTGF